MRFSMARMTGWLLGVLFFCMGGVAMAETPDFKEGRDYTVLAQPLPEGVAPVTMYFYYGCRTCYQLAEPVAGWSAEKHIAVGLVPAHSENGLVDAARLYHTLGVLGQLKHYSAGYVLFQSQQHKAQGVDRINEFLDEIGVERELFWAAWESDAVNQRLAGSLELTRLAGIASTPAFVVHGRYKVELSVIESVDGLFELLEYLVSEKAAAPEDSI
ncbi:MAG TPA: hypothetical protein DCQ80_09535 [Pseudomonas sp.]|nr:hypothetical protein [Pseudomonas sp.]